VLVVVFFGSFFLPPKKMNARAGEAHGKLKNSPAPARGKVELGSKTLVPARRHNQKSEIKNQKSDKPCDKVARFI
jgi:hypothetical protein